MKRYEMIKDKELFSFIIKKGKFIKNKLFVIYHIKNNRNQTNFGIALKNSIGKAVIRNKLKRQIRRIIDNNRKLFKNDEDYIIMIRNECLNHKYQEMEYSFIDLLKGIKK